MDKREEETKFCTTVSHQARLPLLPCRHPPHPDNSGSYCLGGTLTTSCGPDHP